MKRTPTKRNTPKPMWFQRLVPWGGAFLILLDLFGCVPKQTQGKPKQASQSSSTTSATPSDSLHLAILKRDMAATRQYIEAGSDLNRRDQYGSTPLIIAATFGNAEAARALIDAGASLELTNNEGSTPLHIAAFLCRTDIVEALLDNGADKNARNNAGRTPADSVSAPFENVKPIYDKLGTELGPLGLKLDYEYIKVTRPKVLKMLQ